MELVERVKPNIWALTRWDRIKSTAEPRRDQGLTFSAYRLLQSATMTDSIAPATGERKQIVVLGPTGSGKTRFINQASGSNLAVGQGLESCTTHVQRSEPLQVDHQSVVLIDTPGFNDTTRSPLNIYEEILGSLKDLKFDGIIYMHSISDNIVGASTLANFQWFRKICGDKAMKNTVIVTNM
ncbi:hypothetical protein AcW1_005909 [Taiwanofungus camphoratus]|nr:hypothetical protein AcW2_004662 [Antrodia cinnamomea]KAI0934357.1 hypothetical protein AcV5_006224 [Antrodia cinnamomea]KAI0950351.1 hypothetical protein AcV7_008847 [Antrodia cinnamomea]KAI0957555.1 hypothetical protein AcW1_005909 [Antrodia cinnamomea]